MTTLLIIEIGIGIHDIDTYKSPPACMYTHRAKTRYVKAIPIYVQAIFWQTLLKSSSLL